MRRIRPVGVLGRKPKNLSHYKPTDPDVNRGNRQKCLKAGRNALPADHQAAIFLLEPGKCALRLESRDHFFAWSPTVFEGVQLSVSLVIFNEAKPQEDEMPSVHAQHEAL